MVGAIFFEHHTREDDRQLALPEHFQQRLRGLGSLLDMRTTELVDIDKAIDEIDQDETATLTDARCSAQALMPVDLFLVQGLTTFGNSRMGEKCVGNKTRFSMERIMGRNLLMQFCQRGSAARRSRLAWRSDKSANPHKWTNWFNWPNSVTK